MSCSFDWYCRSVLKYYVGEDWKIKPYGWKTTFVDLPSGKNNHAAIEQALIDLYKKTGTPPLEMCSFSRQVNKLSGSKDFYMTIILDLKNGDIL